MRSGNVLYLLQLHAPSLKILWGKGMAGSVCRLLCPGWRDCREMLNAGGFWSSHCCQTDFIITSCLWRDVGIGKNPSNPEGTMILPWKQVKAFLSHYMNINCQQIFLVWFNDTFSFGQISSWGFFSVDYFPLTFWMLRASSFNLGEASWQKEVYAFIKWLLYCFTLTLKGLVAINRLWRDP